MSPHPHFCIAGAQKSATTWLAQCLSEHPDIYIPRQKELHFFCPSSECRFSTAKKGIGWYNDIFLENAQGRITGDCTTDYMYYPGSCEKLFKRNPEMKIIFLLRNPIDRAYSAYWMRKRRCPDLQSFNRLVLEEQAYIQRGFYAEQIQPFIKCFGCQNVHIMVYEELFENPEKHLRALFKFLGLDYQVKSQTTHQKVGATRNLKFGLNRLLYGFMSRIINAPVIHLIWKKMRKNSFLSKIIEYFLELMSKDNYNYPEISEQDRFNLQQIFKNENEKLYQLLDREIEHWKT